MTMHLEPADILRRAHAVGTYYGFAPLASVLSKSRGTLAKGAQDAVALDDLDQNAREVAGLLKRVRSAGHTPASTRPLFVWHSNAAAGRGAPRTILIQFHALGADRAIADAVLIRAVRSFVADISKQEPVLRVNSMGDRETRARLARELTHYFRRRNATLSPECAASAKTDVFSAADMLIKANDRDGMPSATDHLSENSRKHFESVLEYLESTDTPYELAPDLMSRGGVWGETCFSIASDDRVQAWGSRYLDLSKQFFKNPSSSVGAVVRISLDPVKNPSILPAMKDAARPRFVFVHIGDEAKRESMKMADVLRRARIPLTQAIGIESLSEQMRYAEEHNPRYLLIMGRKEALERSVILRERATHSETFIPLDLLVDKLKAVA